MIYVLTTTQGRVFEFYIASCAELYCGMYGGVITLEHREMRECSDSGACDQLELL